MTATKTNERPGTRAVLRHCGMSASKARQVLDLMRGQDVDRAAEILVGTEREAANVIGKVLASAVANAVHNDHQNPDELFVSACYADEGTTAKRWRPRARGRATRIRKRSCHITIIVSRLPPEKLELRRARMEAVSANRSRRVDASRRRADLSGRLSRRRAAQAVAEADAAAVAEAEEVDETSTKAEDVSTETKQDGFVTEETPTEEAATAKTTEDTLTDESAVVDAAEGATDDGAAAMVEEADDPASAEADADEKGK
jgi:large subunit ribosomal protein L22